MYRYPVFESAMNTYFDANDTETRKVLLAVNEEDQSKILTALTSKLYDNVVSKVDDIDFGEVPLTKGNITKLSNYDKMLESCATIKSIMLQFNQDTKKNIDQVTLAIENIASRKDLFIKGYMLNMELPIVVYNTMTLAVVKALSYMISNCIEFIKSPNSDSFDTIIERTSVMKTEQHLLFDNLRKFNSSCSSNELDRALDYVIKSGSKNFIGEYMIAGQAIAAIGILLSIIPIMRELIYFYYYNRVRASDYFALQADLLQMNAYNIQNSRPDLSKDEKAKIVNKQLTVMKAFRAVSDKISVDCKKSEISATKDIVNDSKKFKTTDIMDEMPDSAASSIF